MEATGCAQEPGHGWSAQQQVLACSVDDTALAEAEIYVGR